MRALIRLVLAALLTLVATPALAGPAWWRVSDGRSVLWILGAPDVTLVKFEWDETSLNRRIDAADRLFYPLLSGRVLRPPPGPMRIVNTSTNISPAFLPRQLTIQTDPHQRQVPIPGRIMTAGAYSTPPDLMAQVKTAVDRRDRTAFAYVRNLIQTWQIAAWLDTTDWPKGVISNEVSWKAYLRAHAKGVAITEVPVQAMVGSGPPAGPTPPQARQEVCLKRVLAETGQLAAIRVAGLAAWASGDVEHALKRASDLPLCLMGELGSTDPQAFFERQAFIYTAELDTTFAGDKPGNTVAVVAFDPLLATGGVLDHYRRLGYEIQLTDGME